MDLSSNAHYSLLSKAYDEVGKLTWEHDDFIASSIDISRDYYTEESLIIRQPVPKNLEVYALLSGLPFSQKITERLVYVQQEISNILGDSLHYWVLPSNFGIEYCVFKWPNDHWNELWLDPIQQQLGLLNSPSFLLSINGIQVNPDGCVVAKGYDENGAIFKIRENLKKNLTFLPEKQSGWAHIPIGRILEPIGSSKFLELSYLIKELSESLFVSDRINLIKFIYETRWYMEEKVVLSEYCLA